ncbi:hypothetical protein AB6A40_009345 [Gnathostoma spinigerum]|uniref:Thioredoxin n=1 Tax=Gnathostoma spinigerum TaxID=75299 RepID=A0ABD6ETJ8_9BILA
MVVETPIGKDAFRKQLDDAGEKLVVVDFFATWCHPCKVMGPKFEKMSYEYGNKAVFIKIDIDAEEEVSDDYDINVMPTFILLKNGKPIARIEGNVPEELRKAIASNL